MLRGTAATPARAHQICAGAFAHVLRLAIAPIRRASPNSTTLSFVKCNRLNLPLLAVFSLLGSAVSPTVSGRCVEMGSMSDAEWMRDQAERCLRLARATNDPVLADRLMARAADYLESAQVLERVAGGSSITPATPRQQPAQQQQQIQPRPEED